MSLSHAQLVALTTNAAADLQDLAHAITRTVDTLPRNTSRGTVGLLEQQARRALAIAAALRVEEQRPDEAVVRALLAAKKALTVVVIAVLATVAVGFGEAVGSDAYHSLKNFVETRLQEDTHEKRDADSGNKQLSVGRRLRALRMKAGLSQFEWAFRAGISPSALSRYENDRSRHNPDVLYRLLNVASETSGQTLPELLDEFGIDQTGVASRFSAHD